MTDLNEVALYSSGYGGIAKWEKGSKSFVWHTPPKAMTEHRVGEKAPMNYEYKAINQAALNELFNMSGEPLEYFPQNYYY